MSCRKIYFRKPAPKRNPRSDSDNFDKTWPIDYVHAKYQEMEKGYHCHRIKKKKKSKFQIELE